jgi:hypothetical protein
MKLQIAGNGMKNVIAVLDEQTKSLFHELCIPEKY